MHVKTAAPIIFYVNPHTRGEAQLSYFHGFDGGQRSRKVL